MADEVTTAAENKQEQAVQPSEQAQTENAEVKETKPEASAELSNVPKKKRVKINISAAVKEESGSAREEKAAKKKADKTLEEKAKQEEARKQKFAHLKIFNRWPLDVVVNDLGLRNYINLNPIIVPWTAGRNIKKQFWKSRKSIVERLMLKLMVAGHKGKKHFRTSNTNTGKLATQYNTIKKAFEIIETKTKKNPVEVLVRALENGAPREGVATIEYGGVRYPKAADMAPQRRIDLCLRWMTQAAFGHSAKGKKHVWEALADEIIGTSNNDSQKSNAIAKKMDVERQSGASR
ncbi:MAG: hypothetical protein AABX75_00500 [Nanoarchaeota archaeon]